MADPRTRRPRRIVVLLAVAVLALAACSDDEPDTDAEPATETTDAAEGTVAGTADSAAFCAEMERLDGERWLAMTCADEVGGASDGHVVPGTT